MKSFKEHITEKWIATGPIPFSDEMFDIFKTPTHSEYIELVKSMPSPDDFAGILSKRGDIYIFAGVLHTEAAESIKGYNFYRDTKFAFRGTVKGNKIIDLSPGGDTPKFTYDSLQQHYAETKKHKSLKKHIHSDIQES